MKQTFYFALFILIFLCSTSCKKESLELITTPIPPALIKTQGCFSPKCITLFIAHPSDDFFYENSEKHKIEWYKNGEFFRNGYRLSCMHSGIYKAIITYTNSKQIQELTYELDLDLTE